MKVYVSDSYHTQMIADALQDLYGEKVAVVCELVFTPVDDAVGTALKSITDVVQHYENKHSIDKIDLFFISARAVLEGQINIEDLKKKYANPNAKVVVMSVSEDYLNDVRKGNFGADFYVSKEVFLRANPEQQLTEENKNLLLSYLN